MRFITALLLLCSYFCQAQSEETAITQLLNNWHKAAAEADFDNYFDKMTKDAVFIGTDATENWSKKDFMTYAKPFFDAGKAWDFTALERHIFFNKAKDIAWFDELLDTQMKICRGSGVLVKAKGSWKIQHYVLSMTIPNTQASKVVQTKAKEEDHIIELLKQD